MSAVPITLDALVEALTIRDLTDPAQGPHAMQLLVDAAVASLSESTEVDLTRTPPVVPLEDHYDRLGYEVDAIARDARYTRYVGDACVLRGHTSAGVPPLCVASPTKQTPTTCSSCSRASVTGATPSTDGTPAPRTSSTCGNSGGAGDGSTRPT
jgi:hypothetical protein